MRHIRSLALAVGGALIFAGVVAASSSAAGVPTWYECAKASPKNTGEYTNKTCTEPSEAGKGAYVLKEGIGKGKAFKGKGGLAVLHVKTWLGDNKVECAASKDSGELGLPNLEKNVTVIFSKCVALGTYSCASPGAKKGEIKISGLEGELGEVEESPLSVGLKLESQAHPGPEGELGSFSCEKELSVKVTGGLIGVVAKDVGTISKESETIYVPEEYIGEHVYGTYHYHPIVNIVGWAGEQAEIAEEIAADEKGEIAKIERPILKTLICGAFIESLLNVECTPEAYTGLTSTSVNKGEALEIKVRPPVLD